MWLNVCWVVNVCVCLCVCVGLCVCLKRLFVFDWDNCSYLTSPLYTLPPLPPTLPLPSLPSHLPRLVILFWFQMVLKKNRTAVYRNCETLIYLFFSEGLHEKSKISNHGGHFLQSFLASKLVLLLIWLVLPFCLMVDKLDCSLIVYFRALKRKYDEYYKIMIPPNHHSKR